MIRKSNRAITLIALIITIVVMLILAAITVNLVLGENGIIKRAKEAALMQKKAQYMEEINIAIAEEQLDRTATHKDEPFITSLANRLSPEKKKWVKSVIKCSETNGALDQKENDEENNILHITTKEDYEMLVDVDNSTSSGKIRSSFTKANAECLVTYDSNAAGAIVTGTVENQSVKPGFTVKTRDNSYERSGYEFIGWSKYQTGKDSNDQDDIYAIGSKIRIDEDTILYAQWSQVTATITFDKNASDATGEMQPLVIGLNTQTNLTANGFLRDGYTFSKWNSNKDGSGTDYTDTITVNDDITLYAQWNRIMYTITFDANGGSVNPASVSVPKGETLSLPTPERNGYAFAGWFTQNNEQVSNSTVFNEAKTLYAHWNSYVAAQSVVIKGGKNESVTITTPRETLTRTLDATGSLSTTINLAMEENVTLVGNTSGYQNVTTYTGSELLARPEHFIYWYGIVNTEYGGLSAVGLKSWSGGANLAPTITYNTNYFTASVTDSSYVNRAGNAQATNSIDITDFTKLKAQFKSGSVYLSRNGGGINGGVDLAILSPTSTYRDGTYRAYTAVMRNYDSGDRAGTTSFSQKKDVELNITNQTGNYNVGIFLSIVCGTTTADTYAIWLE